MQPQIADFRGTDRFRLLRCLGPGSNGIVYEAYDRERHETIALKLLRHLSADALLRFKHEFRAVHDVQHPNLVTLGELIEEAGHWFFTMELVEGVDLLRYVRPPRPAPISRGPHDFARLRSSFAQLARGLHSLHAARRVHRDIKPLNVLVDQHGRVVILDFGLVIDASPDERPAEPDIVGTVAYMAPEQAAGRAVGPEADWYSVGVVLYEALTGRVPFFGPTIDVLVAKQRLLPPSPDEIRSDVPADLAGLCRDLLRIGPGARPSGLEVLERLGARATGGSSARLVGEPAPPFVGRARELVALEAALDECRRERLVTVLLAGESGVGKSALLRRFAQAAARGGALVLSGRCHERESVPYKALDGVVDALSRHLSALPDEDAEALLPPDAPLLARRFAVLRQVRALARPPSSTDASLDRPPLRAQLHATLDALLARLAARRPLVITVDDLQWADPDSLTLLRAILAPDRRMALAFVGTLRVGGAVLPGARLLPIGPLPAHEARELASQMLRALGLPGAPPDAATVIADEAAGHPLFMEELARRAHGGASLDQAVCLDEALWARIRDLTLETRRVLQLVAVAGRPVRQEVIAEAGTFEPGALGTKLSALRAARLVRTSGMRRTDLVETYHERVREAVLARLTSDERRECHRRLALACELRGGADAQTLAFHWAGADEPERSARCAQELSG